MAYSTGSATDVNDLLSKIRNFLTANGYTEDSYAAAGAGYRLNIHKDGMYFNFRSSVNENVTQGASGGNFYGIAMSAATGYDAGAEGADNKIAWKTQPGAPYYYGQTGIKLAVVAGNITGAVPQYHFFANTDGFILCIERASGFWEHLAGGQLTNFGTAQALDGFFFAGSGSGYDNVNNTRGLFTPNYSVPNAFIYYEHASVSFAQKWWGTNSYVGASGGYFTVQSAYSPFPVNLTSSGAYNLGYLQSLLRSVPSIIGNLTPLFPSYFSIGWIDSSDFLIGHFDSIRCSIITAFTPLQEIVIGDDTWKIFPVTNVNNTTRPYAIAVKKVA